MEDNPLGKKGAGPIYMDHTSPIEDRVEDLVSRMTLEEKVSQLVHEAPAVERLGIPEYNWWNEALHGVGRAGVATVFPQAIGLAATWNTDLMLHIATAIADEARAKHHEFLRQGNRQIYTGLTMYSPNVNIFRDPRWGRGQETYGEDPYLTSRMGVAFVRGMQGDDPHYLKLVTTAKHYAVHSGPEPDRHSFDARVSERDLRETYLPAFAACVREGGVASVMGAYNRVNGEPCCASRALLQRILREEWGFDGFVVSDAMAIRDIYQGHHLVATPAEAAALALEVGCDLEVGNVYGAMLETVAAGPVDEATVDRALKRIFAARFRLGMFDPPEVVPYAQIPFATNDSLQHHGLALQASRECIVLLKNEGNTLPLRKDLGSIAVIGPNADDLLPLLGNYNGTPSLAVTPLEGIRKKLPGSARVYYARGCEIAVGVPPLTVIPSDHLRPAPADGPQAGLTAEYFGGAGFDAPPANTRIDPVVDFTWKGRTDPFAVRWTGFLVPPVTGTYRLGVSAMNDQRLFLDGEPLLEQKANHHSLTRTRDVELEASRLYRIELDYVNRGIDPQVQLLWSVPGVDYAAEAIEAARQAEVVVMVMGLSPSIEGEEMPVRVEGFLGGDRTDIALPRPQEDLLRRLHALGKPIVLVLLGGSALAVKWAAGNVPAIVESWYPGQFGGDAIADVVFGDHNPGGRLPVTFYTSVDQLPPFADYRMAGRTYRFLKDRPLFPFGHGLSYTRFEYANLQVTPGSIDAAGEVTVSCDVRNVGDRAGDEVAQLYVRHPRSRVPRPAKELKGFERIALQPGETKTVSFVLPPGHLAFYDADRFVVEAGPVEVMVGASSDDIRLTGKFAVSGGESHV